MLLQSTFREYLAAQQTDDGRVIAGGRLLEAQNREKEYETRAPALVGRRTRRRLRVRFAFQNQIYAVCSQ